MRVRMKVAISGTRDGESWPARGGVVDLPDDEAEHMIAGGLVEEADDEDETEEPAEENAANPAKPETATARRKGPMTKSAVDK
jgi:hypothetical protein